MAETTTSPPDHAAQLVSEGLQPVADLAAEFGVDAATVRRWCRLGVRGQKLECVLLGGSWRSSRKAVLRFLARHTN